MTLAETGNIFEYWESDPPGHVMIQAIARMLGWTPPSRETPPIADIIAMAPPGVALAPGGDLGMPAPMLDIKTLRERNRERLANSPATL